MSRGIAASSARPITPTRMRVSQFDRFRPGDFLCDMHHSDALASELGSHEHQVAAHVRLPTASSQHAVIEHIVREHWGDARWRYTNKMLTVVDCQVVADGEGQAGMLKCLYCYDHQILGVVALRLPLDPDPPGEQP